MAVCEQRCDDLASISSSILVQMDLNKAPFCWFQSDTREMKKAVDFGRPPSVVLSHSNVRMLLRDLGFSLLFFFILNISF